MYYFEKGIKENKKEVIIIILNGTNIMEIKPNRKIIMTIFLKKKKLQMIILYENITKI